MYHATISNDFPNADSIALFVCQLQYCISCQVKLKNGFQHFPPVFDIQDLEVRDYQNGDLFPGNYVFLYSSATTVYTFSWGFCSF